METTGKVTFGKVNTASVEVSNINDADRRYGITANVDVSEGKVMNLHNGIVTDLENDQHLASFGQFDSMGSGRFSITYLNDSCDRVEVFKDANEFFDNIIGKDANILAE